MTETRYFCNRCGVQIREGRVQLAVLMPTQRDFTDADLCAPCGRAFTAWLASGQGKGATAPPPPADHFDVSRTL